jgi:hypothetical protein
MLAAGMIFPVDEAEWISPIIIQRKKGIEDIRVCVDYRSLNIACVHDPFPTPFSDEVLDQVAGNEAILLQMGFLAITRLELLKRTRKRLHSLPSGDHFPIMLCLLGSRIPQRCSLR